MQKTGLKLWSVNKNYFDESKRLFEDGFYDYIELYVVPESLEFIDCWKNLKVPYVIHGPHYGHGLNFADARKNDDNMRMAQQAVKFADALNAEYIIFHPGVDGVIEETARQLNQIKDSRVLIENKPYHGLGNEICTGNRPEEIEYVMKQCEVGCCLDIGHAICAANSHKIDRITFLRKFINLAPAVYHLSDGDIHGEYDSHEHLGKGNYDLNELLGLLPSKSTTISIETKKDSENNLDDFVKDIVFLRNINKQIVIRKARESDAMAVFNLNNSPDVRKQSISTDKIVLENHKNWFKQKLQSDKEQFYIIETRAGKFVGQVRFDLQACGQWLISIAIAKEFRAKGFGTWAIIKASRMAQIACDFPVIAYVRKENEISSRAFVNADFVFAAEETIKGGLFFRFDLLPLSKRFNIGQNSEERLPENCLKSIGKFKKMDITILVDKTSWFNEYVPILKTLLEKHGHTVKLISSKKELEKGDVAFFLSCFEIIDPENLKKHKHNIVVHASDLPQNKGWSPMTWQILEGKNKIPLTLFEAIEKCDAGCIYLQDTIELDGTELLDEWQKKLAAKTIALCETFIEKYDSMKGKEQSGTENFYKRRKPSDSKLDINKTIKEQFNLLRTVDNKKYPAFFEIAGEKYVFKIEKFHEDLRNLGKRIND